MALQAGTMIETVAGMRRSKASRMPPGHRFFARNPDAADRGQRRRQCAWRYIRGDRRRDDGTLRAAIDCLCDAAERAKAYEFPIAFIPSF
jgi:hypothetical protein